MPDFKIHSDFMSAGDQMGIRLVCKGVARPPGRHCISWAQVGGRTSQPFAERLGGLSPAAFPQPAWAKRELPEPSVLSRLPR